MSTIRIMTPLAALGLLACAAPSEADDGSPPARKPLTEARCERLVERLVSPGKRPFSENYVLDLPRGVNTKSLHETQKCIAAAYNELSDNIESALPVLMKHINDRRFSYVYEEGISGTYHTAEVGIACYRIIFAHVNIYSEPVTKYDSDGRSKSLYFIEDGCGGLEKWWKGRRGRSLADLQREGIEWARRQPKPDYFSERQWASAKKELGKLSARISATKEPIPVEHHVRFFPR